MTLDEELRREKLFNGLYFPGAYDIMKGGNKRIRANTPEEIDEIISTLPNKFNNMVKYASASLLSGVVIETALYCLNPQLAIMFSIGPIFFFLAGADWLYNSYKGKKLYADYLTGGETK